MTNILYTARSRILTYVSVTSLVSTRLILCDTLFKDSTNTTRSRERYHFVIPSFTMIYLQFLTTVVALIGVFLNIKMLLNCFKNQTKTKPLIISQFVYQVAILALNTVEVWTDEDAESYRLFRHLMSTFLSTVLAFNWVAILLSKYFHQNPLLPFLLALVSLVLGLLNSVDSVLAWWIQNQVTISSNHFSFGPPRFYQFYLLIIMIILVFGLHMLVALNFASKVEENIAIISEKPAFSVLYRENQLHEEATDTTMKSTPQSEALPEKRLLSKTLFLVQFGTMISIFFLLWLSSTEESYRSVFYQIVFLSNYAAGILFPLTVITG